MREPRKPSKAMWSQAVFQSIAGTSSMCTSPSGAVPKVSARTRSFRRSSRRRPRRWPAPPRPRRPGGSTRTTPVRRGRAGGTSGRARNGAASGRSCRRVRRRGSPLEATVSVSAGARSPRRVGRTRWPSGPRTPAYGPWPRTGGQGHGRPALLPVQELHDAPLAPLTTFRLGGPAARLLTATTDAEVIAAVREADASGTPLLVIGGGSNLVMGTRASTAPRCASPPRASRSRVRPWSWRPVRCGPTPSPGPSRRASQGIECLAGIPGSAGATPSRTSARTGRRCPPPSRRSWPTTGAPRRR
ncbi:UDP-N-acetylenolpyruvoylglucosamine reductase [Streptomyces griseus]